MAKITLTLQQFELAKRLGMVKVQDGKMFLLQGSTSKEVWSGAVPTMPPPIDSSLFAPATLNNMQKAFTTNRIEYSDEYTLDDLRGKTFDRVYVNDDKSELIFENAEYEFKLLHEEDCCECVQIEDIVGDLDDLVGRPLDIVEEVEYDQDYNPPDVKPVSGDSFTWTFYKFATIKGYVDVRWLGESNGYYSEAVDFVGRKK